MQHSGIAVSLPLDLLAPVNSFLYFNRLFISGQSQFIVFLFRMLTVREITERVGDLIMVEFKIVMR